MRAAFLAAVLCACLVPGAAPASPRLKFSVEGTAIRYHTGEIGKRWLEIADGDAAYLRKLLAETPGVRTLILDSSGGGYYPAFDMSRVVMDYGLDTRVDGECSSSCAIIFLGGAARGMTRGSFMGFHQTSWTPEGVSNFYDSSRVDYGWDSPFEFASWLYEDTQEEVFSHLTFMVSRGVDPEFAIESIRNRGDDMWYPDRAELKAAGVLRARR